MPQGTPSGGTGGRRLVMGRVVGSYGIKGWVRVAAYTGEPGSLARFPAWWVRRGGAWTRVEVLETAVQGRHLLARWEGCETREEAALWRGAEIAVDRTELPPLPPGEYYWADLEGLEVVNGRGEPLGRVTEVFSNGAHDILRTREGAEDGSGRERLIPFIPQVVLDVALEDGRIRVDWERDW